MRDAKRIQHWLNSSLQGIICIGFAFSLYRHQWLNALLIVGIIVLIMLPTILGKRFSVYIPIEFELIATLFIFAAIFLGELGGYYLKFWWWDIVLHTSSGSLLGIVGFLLVFIMNQEKRIQVHMNPGFVALFALSFAISIGVIWEIFEFAMDTFFGLNMQKSGLVDTMWDLIVYTLGALVVVILGYLHMKSGTTSFLDKVIFEFFKRNPRFFKKQ